MESLWRDTERIAIVRPPDSPGNAAVRAYIVSQFNSVHPHLLLLLVRQHRVLHALGAYAARVCVCVCGVSLY
jgi:hypothetical protein